MTGADPDSVVRRGDVVWRSLLDGVLVRRPGDDDDVLLAGTGVALWAELATEIRVDELVARLADAHRATPELVATDVIDALDDLVARGVVVRG